MGASTIKGLRSRQPYVCQYEYSQDFPGHPSLGIHHILPGSHRDLSFHGRNDRQDAHTGSSKGTENLDKNHFYSAEKKTFHEIP